MKKNENIDLTLVIPEKLQDVISYASYFNNLDKTSFYTVSKDGDMVYEYGDQVKGFIKTLYEANLIQPFNWVNWKETNRAQYLLQNPSHLSEASLEDLVKTLIVIVRSDRFIAGQLKDAIEAGFISAFIKRLDDLFLQTA